MSSLLWKINRLKAMGLPEISYRVRQAVGALLEKRGWGLAMEPPEPRGSFGNPWLQSLPRAFGEARQRYIHRAESVLNGRFNVFSLPQAELGFPPNWHKDPKTGTVSPLDFGKTLNYRDEAIVGDIKYLWEPNRHLELVHLAQAWHLSGESRFLDGARTLLDSWFEQNPYPLGVNWTSSLEHGIRLINWSFAWHFFGGEHSQLFAGTVGADLRRKWLASIYQHSFFIGGHFSRFSSANNHLIGEYAGLFIAAVTWPLWPDSARWLEISQRGLEREARAQNAEDGGNREQAIWYHHEVADMLLLCGLVGRANRTEFSAGYWSRFEAMLEYIASLMDVAGELPMIGDSDDAVIVDLGIERDVYRSLLATGAILFERGDLKAKAKGFDDKSRWLLGDDAQHQFDAIDSAGSQLPVHRAFRETGYYILGDAFETADETRLVADAGDLGYLSIAAHGHADALAFTLSVGGHEILVDPGTYSYHTQQVWRDYFKGTSAHNTVRVDRLDQSNSGGNFLWLRHAGAECLEFSPGSSEDLWLAQHDGYAGLPDPVTHERKIHFDKRSHVLHVTDSLLCKAHHEVELHWHCSERATVRLEDQFVHIETGDVIVEISMPGSPWQAEIIEGQLEPPLGWISRRFDTKVQSPTIRWRGPIDGTAHLETLIKISRTKD